MLTWNLRIITIHNW